MISNSLIVIPFHIPKPWQADYTQQTCKVLSTKNKVIAFLWADSKSFKEIIIDILLNKIIFKIIRIEGNILYFTPVHIFPLRRYRIIDKLNIFINIFVIKVYILLFYFKLKKYLWIFHPSFNTCINFFGKYFRSIYDCVDFYTSKDFLKDKKIRNQENLLIKKADLVFVNSKTLLSLHGNKKKNIYLVPQGFRVDDFRIYSEIEPKNDKTNKKPIIGFVGGINHRLDFKLLIELIKNNPNWDFKFIGLLQKSQDNSYLKTEENLENLFSFPNVEHRVAQEKKLIPKIIDSFDICMIPYNVKDNYNKYCYPMKLFEYFYMGKSVVSTPVEELKRFPKFVKIGKTIEDWEKIIKKLLSKPWPEKYKAEQRKLAIENSWENKIEAISKIIETKYTNSS